MRSSVARAGDGQGKEEGKEEGEGQWGPGTRGSERKSSLTAASASKAAPKVPPKSGSKRVTLRGVRDESSLLPRLAPSDAPGCNEDSSAAAEDDSPDGGGSPTDGGSGKKISSLLGHLASGWVEARTHLKEGRLVEAKDIKRLRAMTSYERSKAVANEAWGSERFEECAKALTECIEYNPSAALYRYRSRAAEKLLETADLGSDAAIAAALADAGRAVQADLRSPDSHLRLGRCLLRAQKLPESGVAFNEAMLRGASGTSDDIGYNELLETIRRQRSYSNLTRHAMHKSPSKDLARSPWRANIFDPSRPKEDAGPIGEPPSAPSLWLTRKSDGSLSVGWEPTITPAITVMDVGSRVALLGEAVTVDGSGRDVVWSKTQRTRLCDVEGRIKSVEYAPRSGGSRAPWHTHAAAAPKCSDKPSIAPSPCPPPLLDNPPLHPPWTQVHHRRQGGTHKRRSVRKPRESTARLLRHL